MLNLLIDILCFLIDAIFLMIFTFLFLCMNVFTVPIYLLLWLFCAIFRLKSPKARFYSLMLYPSWSAKAKYSFWRTVRKWNQKGVAKANAKKRKQFRVTRPWEARFFD